MSTTDAFADDYAAVTESCGLLDQSARGKLALKGADAKRFLQGQVTNDVEALTPDHGLYAAFLTHKGKMLGDLRVLDTGQELLLDTERASLQELFDMIRRYSIGYEVELIKRTVESGLMELIGPRTDETVSAASGGRVPEAGEHDHLTAAIAGHDVRLIRTPVGIDVLLEAEATPAVRDALVLAGARVVDLAAAECLRIETGRPRYGVDLDDTVIPQEAGLNERAVSFTKGCYVGQETVARLFYKGKPNRELRGLRGDRMLSTGDTILLGDRTVGVVTSAADSPRFGPIALALVRREAELGTDLETEHGATASVVALPFAGVSAIDARD